MKRKKMTEEEMWATKRARQALYREQVRQGLRTPEDMFFIPRAIAKTLKIEHRVVDFDEEAGAEEMSDTTSTKFHWLLKHSMSCARDGLVNCEIDWSTKTITVRMMDQQKKDFISSAHLAQLVSDLLPEKGIHAFYDDDVKSWQPDVPHWSLVLMFAGQRLPFRVVRQRKLDGGGSPYVVEISPTENMEDNN